MNRTAVILPLIFVLSIGSIAWLRHSAAQQESKSTTAPRQVSSPVTKNDPVAARLKDKAADARKYVAEHNFSDRYAFLVDMSVASGSKRFFIYDLAKDSVTGSGLVTHGRCNLDWLEGRMYDNTLGCGCTSLGKYKVGYSYMGRFGLAYKLYGLEKTNDNAFARYVVLHSHECVPESPTSDDICQSDGCPTVSPDFLLQLKKIINASKRPVLLWIYG